MTDVQAIWQLIHSDVEPAIGGLHGNGVYTREQIDEWKRQSEARQRRQAGRPTTEG